MRRLLPSRPADRAALARDARGATILEFGLVAPILCVMLLGALDVGHTLYMQAMLQGAVQKAARDGSLETATGSSTTVRDAIDTRVKEQLLNLNRSATIGFDRQVYKSFTEAKAAQAEIFTDTATGVFHDGKCNNGEAFEDRNNNGRFDRTGGNSADKAGARDIVVYTVSISYPRMFPLDRLIGGNGTTSLNASTVLGNQPYGTQTQYGTASLGHCGVGTPGVEAPQP